MLGDVIVSVAGQAITEPEDLMLVLRPERVGSVVPVRIVRGGESRELQVTVGERPSRG